MTTAMSLARSQEAIHEKPGLQKPINVVDTAYNLYGFLPADGDERWGWLARYVNVRENVGFKAINFANAWSSALYLSSTPSYRVGFVNSINPENNLQLSRALDNLSHYQELKHRFLATSGDFSEFDFRFTRTDRLNHEPDKERPVTPCPEALYQVQLYEDDEYLARAAFNVHLEGELAVLSVANIQGRPGGMDRNRRFRANHGVSPFNIAVRKVAAMARTEEPNYEVRGLLNPLRGNTQLYWGVLQTEGIPHYHVTRKNVGSCGEPGAMQS